MSLYFNGTNVNYDYDIRFNGTSLSNIYFNGTLVWSAKPNIDPSRLLAYASNSNTISDGGQQWAMYAFFAPSARNNGTELFTFDGIKLVAKYNCTVRVTLTAQNTGVGGIGTTCKKNSATIPYPPNSAGDGVVFAVNANDSSQKYASGSRDIELNIGDYLTFTRNKHATASASTSGTTTASVYVIGYR